MPLHGKVVVIKRSGVDGTEFPLTAACVFGRKAECDIRIQLPQVSKEHCKIDLNENKEVIVTNLSSINPTRINGEVLQQSERLKHGDLITIFDRSFRFEYPPAPTPKKRSSTGGKSETLRVLQDKQPRDTTAAETVDKTSEAPSNPGLKDGTNNDNIQRTPEKAVEVESTDSPFGDLYQMIKKTLDSKSPWKPSGSQPQTPATRFCTPQPVSVRKATGEVPTLPKAEECTPKEVKAEESSVVAAVEGDAGVENVVVATPKSVKKAQNSFQCGLAAEEKPLTEQAANPATPLQETPKHKRRSLTSKTPTATVATSSPLKKPQATPQKFTVTPMVEQASVENPPMTPTRRQSKVATPIKPAVTEAQDQTEALPSTPKTNPSPRHSPRTAEKKLQAQEATPIKPAVTEVQDQAEALPSTPKTNPSPRHSPRTAEKKRQAQEKQQAQEVAQVIETAATVNVTAAKKRKSEELGADLTMPRMKRKRVSFGGHLSPELFDKRMPPDSPLRKGAAPRRSLCVPKLSASLLRRASVSGFPKAKSPSPAKKSSKAKTPSPAKKSPKAKTPSPAKKSPKAKTPSPAKKSPKAKTPSPAKKSPNAKTPSPAKKSPKAKTPSSTMKSPKAKTPSPKTPSSAKKSMSLVGSAALEGSTPTVQGRFSVSRISTPSPVAEAISAQEPSATMTPKLPLRRKSMKSASQNKPNTMAKNVVEVMRRRSGVSRASLKVVNSWANIVKFGQKKSQAVAQEAKKASAQIKKKKAVQPKHKTPAKIVQNYASTGHADSPVSIVVGRAHKRVNVQPTGAAPRLVHNVVLLKNMKMDEDLTGISEIFSTPVGAKQRKSSVVSLPLSASKTPVSTSVIEASVMNTPEETGEMIVSPLAVASSAKSGKYNREAVERLFLDDDKSSFVSEEEVPIDDVSEKQCPDLETEMTTTPQQKPPQPDCLTGVKRLLKSPRQKLEPVEDLRGKLLKTPKQKTEQVECLTGVKRIMKTPRQKAEPVEDIRGKLLMTPKAEKPEQPEQPDCLSGVKKMMKTPRQKAESVVDLEGKLKKTPKASAVMEEVSVAGVEELLETPIHKEPLKDLIDVTDAAPEVKSSLLVCTTDTVEGMVNVESLMKTPKKEEPIDGLMKTPKQMEEPVEESKSLMKTPRLSGNPPVEDLQKAEPVEDIRGKLLMTPKAEKPEQPEQPDCLSGVKKMMKTPRQKAESVVDLEGKLKKTPKASAVMEEVSVAGVEELLETPIHKEPLKDLIDVTDAAPEVKSSLLVCTTDTVEGMVNVESLMKTPKKEEPIDGLMKTPKQMEEPVEESKSLMKTPRLSGNPPVEDLQKAEPVEDIRGKLLMTPKAEKPEQPEQPDCLSGVKKMMKTPRQKAESVVDLEGKLKKTPKASAVMEEVSVDGVEELLETPIHKEPLKDLIDVTDAAPEVKSSLLVCTTDTVEGMVNVESLMKTPKKEEPIDGLMKTPKQMEEPVEESKSLMKTPRLSGNPPVEDLQEPQELMEEPLTNVTVQMANIEGHDEMQPQNESDKSQQEPEVETTAEKPRRGGRKIKQDTKSGSTEAQDIQPTVVTEKPKRGGRAKTGKVIKEVEIMVEAEPEPAKDDVPDEQLGDAQSSTAIQESEMPVLKTRGRGRRAKQDLPETQAALEEAVPAEKPRRGGRKSKPETQNVVSCESTEVLDKPLAIATETPKKGRTMEEEKLVTEVEMISDEPEEKPATTSTAIDKIEMPVLKTRGRGRKAKQDLPEAIESQEAHEEAVAVPHEEAVVIPAEKPRRGGRKIKQDTQSVVPPESTEAQDLQPTVATEKPKRGGRAKKVTVVKEVEIMVEAEPAMDDVPEEKLGDTQSSTAEESSPEETEMPVLKPSGRGRRAKQALPEAQTQEAHEEAVPAEKPRRGGRKKATTMKEETLVKEVEIISEEPEEKPEHTQEDVQEENTVDLQTAPTTTAIKKSEMPVLKTRGRGRKAKQDLPEAVEETKEEHKKAVIPAEKPKRGGRKTKSVEPTDSTEVQDKPHTITTDAGIVIKEVEIVSEQPGSQDDVQEKISGDAPVVQAGKRRKANSAVKDDYSQSTPAKRSRRGEAPPSLQEAAVVETTVPVTKSPARGRGKPKSVTVNKAQDAESKTKVSRGPVRKGRKASPADDTVSSTEEVMEEVEDELQNPQSKKSVVWKDDLTVTHIISPAVRAVRGRKAKLADVPSPRPSPAKRDQSVESVECPASEATASTKPGSKRKSPKNVSVAEEEDLSEKNVPSEPIKKGRRVKATDAALVETVTPATEVPETKPRRGRPAKK